MIKFYTQNQYNMNDVRKLSREFYEDPLNKNKHLVLPIKEYNPVRYLYHVLNNDGDCVASYQACTFKSLDQLFNLHIDENGKVQKTSEWPNSEFLQFDKSKKIKSFKDFYKN
jgi:hypothetical protein